MGCGDCQGEEGGSDRPRPTGRGRDSTRHRRRRGETQQRLPPAPDLATVLGVNANISYIAGPSIEQGLPATPAPVPPNARIKVCRLPCRVKCPQGFSRGLGRRRGSRLGASFRCNGLAGGRVTVAARLPRSGAWVCDTRGLIYLATERVGNGEAGGGTRCGAGSGGGW